MDKFTKVRFNRLKKGSAFFAAMGFVAIPVAANPVYAEDKVVTTSNGEVSLSDFFKAAASYIFTDTDKTAYFIRDSWLYSRPYAEDDTKSSISKYEFIHLTGTNSGDFWRVEKDSQKWYVKKADLTTDEEEIEKLKAEEEEEAKKAAEAKENTEKAARELEAKQKAEEKKQKKEEAKKKAKEKKEKQKKDAESRIKEKQKAIEKLKKETKALQRRAGSLNLDGAEDALKQVNDEIAQAEKEQAEAITSQKIANSNADRGTKAVAIAKTKLGSRYVFGSEGPETFDCSGLTRWVYRQLGISLPRSAAEQYNAVTHTVTPSVGDLVFFRNTYKPGISHVGIVIGNGMMIHAANRNSGLIISSYRTPYYSSRFAGFGKMPD